MERAVLFFCVAAFSLGATFCHPTTYKLNENYKLEPDLVPVSSTVIPLPVYQVAFTLGTLPTLKDEKVTKPDGPISLVTVHNAGAGRKKAVPTQKTKKHQSDYTSVKQISKKEFDD